MKYWNAFMGALFLACALIASYLYVYNKGAEHGAAHIAPKAFEAGRQQQFSEMFHHLKTACTTSKPFAFEGQRYICAPTISL